MRAAPVAFTPARRVVAELILRRVRDRFDTAVDPAIRPSKLVMVDPSLLFAQDGIEWLAEDPTARRSIVVSASALNWMRDEAEAARPASLLAEEDFQAFSDRREQVLRLVDQVPAFSYRDAEAGLSSEHNVVMFNLLSNERLPEVVRNIYADEWAFLQSQSILLSKLRKPLEAFRDGGSAIVEFGRETGYWLLRRVIPAEHIPPVLSPQFLAKATAKWIVLGGAMIGGGTLGGLVGTAVGGPLGWATGKVVGTGAGAVTGAALLAIDP